jgi:HEAT repeat protein
MTIDNLVRKNSKLTEKDLHIKHIYIAEALGNLGRGENTFSKEINSTLTDMLKNSPDAHVRFTAALALARLGPLAKESMSAVVEALEDENRYVVGNALLALEKINTPESIGILLEYLKYMRWDPKTSEESQY